MQTYYFYKIFCKNPEIEDIYIGKTCNLSNRMNQHKFGCKHDKDIKLYNFINNNGGWENFNYNILREEEFICEKDATIVENELYLQYTPSLNTYRPIQDKNETKIKRHNGKKKFRLNKKKNTISKKINDIKVDFDEMKTDIIMEIENFNKEINNVKHIIVEKIILAKLTTPIINNHNENVIYQEENNEHKKSKYQIQIDKRKTDPKYKEYQKEYRKRKQNKL